MAEFSTFIQETQLRRQLIADAPMSVKSLTLNRHKIKLNCSKQSKLQVSQITRSGKGRYKSLGVSQFALLLRRLLFLGLSTISNKEILRERWTEKQYSDIEDPIIGFYGYDEAIFPNLLNAVVETNALVKILYLIVIWIFQFAQAFTVMSKCSGNILVKSIEVRKVELDTEEDKYITYDYDIIKELGELPGDRVKDQMKDVRKSMRIRDDEIVLIYKNGIRAYKDLTSTRYAAVSYVWSDNKDITSVLVNIKKIADEVDLPVWVDCISTRYGSKLTEDIKNMGNIYRNSVFTYIQLGEFDLRNVRLYNKLTKIHSYAHLKYTMWNSRVWTLQEMVLPTTLIYGYGNNNYVLPRYGEERELCQEGQYLFSTHQLPNSIELDYARLISKDRSCSNEEDYIHGIAGLTIVEHHQIENDIEFNMNSVHPLLLMCQFDQNNVNTCCWLPRGRIYYAGTTFELSMFVNQNKIPIDKDGMITINAQIITNNDIDMRSTSIYNEGIPFPNNKDKIMVIFSEGQYFSNVWWLSYDIVQGEAVYHLCSSRWVVVKRNQYNMTGNIRVGYKKFDNNKVSVKKIMHEQTKDCYKCIRCFRCCADDDKHLSRYRIPKRTHKQHDRTKL